MSRIVKRYSARFKFKIAKEAMKEDKTLSELSQCYGVSKSAISKWKHQLEANGSDPFDAQHRFMDDKERIKEINRLHAKIGQLNLRA